MFNEEKLENHVKRAKAFLMSKHSSGPDFLHNINAYCVEQASQVRGVVMMAIPEKDDGIRNQSLDAAFEDGDFALAVIGRITFLEGQTMRPTTYAQFNVGNGRNYVDLFLERVGYVPPSK